MNDIKIVRLKDGSELPEDIVAAIYGTLDRLISGSWSETRHFVALVRYCRHGTEISQAYLRRLIELSLMEDDGTVHDAVRDVVLSAVVGEELEMRLVSPIQTDSEV